MILLELNILSNTAHDTDARLRVHIIQPSVPPYRKVFFEYLDTVCSAEFLLYGSPVDEMKSQSVKSVAISHYDGDVKFTRLPFATYYQHIKPDLQSGDILVINGNPRMISNYWLVVKARMKKIPIIWWGHGWSPTSQPWRANVRRFLTKQMADAVLLYTDKERDAYIQAGFDAKCMFALNNGVDTALISSLSKDAISDRSISVITPDAQLNTHFNAVFIGRLTAKSGIDMLIRQFKKIDPDIGLVIIGGGELEDTIAKLIVSLKLSDRVFMAGPVYGEKAIASWMVGCQLFVYPGSVGLSIIHAFAYGLPAVIHSNYQEHGPEAGLFEDEINGIQFKQGDPSSLVKAINTLAFHPRRQEMGEHARQQVISGYSFKTMARRFANVLNYVAGDVDRSKPTGSTR